MTISTTSTKKVYSGNAVATVFAYDFFIQASTDIEVYLADPDGLLELQTLTTDYTLSGVGNPAGGNVTFVSGAPAAGTNNILLIRNTPLTQETDYIEGDTFPAEEHEKALDKLTRICQELSEVLSRAVKLDANDSTDPVELVNNIFAAEDNASNSAAAALASELAAALSATLAQDWATKISGTVDGSEFSAKYYANIASAIALLRVVKTSDTGSAIIPAGTTAERDSSPVGGYTRFNVDTDELEFYDGTTWRDVLNTSGFTMSGLANLNDGDDIASASTVDLTAATGNTVRITGTTAITAFTMNAGQQMELVAVGALPLTYNATTMNINGGVSYTCAAGDRLKVFKDGAGVVRVNVTKQDGTSVAAPSGVAAGVIIDFSGIAAPPGYLACPLVQTNISRTTYAVLWDAIHKESAVTISIASPGVITWNAHGLVNGSPIVLYTTGALPTGLVAGTTYYVVGATTNAFNLSATVGGAAINTSGSQSGVHTAFCAPWGVGDGSTTCGMPWFPADYASVQANSNIGTNHVGEVIAHTHASAAGTGFLYNPGPSGIAGTTGVTAGATPNTASTGGASNRAAGVRILKCVKY